MQKLMLKCSKALADDRTRKDQSRQKSNPGFLTPQAQLTACCGLLLFPSEVGSSGWAGAGEFRPPVESPYELQRVTLLQGPEGAG